MKLNFIIILLAFMHCSAKSLSQKITINVSKAPLEVVLKDISQQTGYVFFYDSKDVKNKNVTVQLKDASLSDALKNCLQDQSFSWVIFNKTIALKLINQEVPIDKTINSIVNGKILDENGQPLPGATIKVKGTNIATLSNTKGEFSISNAPDDAILQISFVGYVTKEISVKQDLTAIQMSAKKSNLNEVVVVGYSSKQLSQISSSISTISGDKLRDVTSTDLGTLLEGKLAGVVASGGSGDPNGGADILIRGSSSINASTSPLIVVDGNIGGTYNTADIESVTILKDAAATGLYGSRAANGVIIITTKKGKAGAPEIFFESRTGVAVKNTGNFHLMNSTQLYDYLKTFYTPSPSDLDNNTNWFDLAFRRALQQNYTLSVSGGTDKTQYYISGNFDDEQGTLIGNSMSSYNFRANITTKLTDKLKLSVLMNSIYTKSNTSYNTSGLLYDAYLNMPFDPAFAANGTPIDARTDSTWVGRDVDNPLYSLQYNFANSESLSNNLDVNLDYNIVKHLTISTYNRATLYNEDDLTFYDPRTKEGDADDGDLYQDFFHSTTLLTSNRIKYDNTFGKHTISILAVGEEETYHDESDGDNGKGLPDGRAVMSTATDIVSNPTGGTDDYNFSKYLAQADYNYDGKYFAVASVVHERSSRFGDNHPGGTFYQGGASWILSNEDFLANIKTINLLKLRTSYGTTGNAEIGNYAATGLYYINQTASYAGYPGAYPFQEANPNLTWEKVSTANLGFDLGLLNRINITFDVYNKNTNGLLFQVPLPATSGYSSVYENVGSLTNKGLEFSINSKNLVGGFKWETMFNIAFNSNRVTSLASGESQASASSILPIGVGHDVNDWYMPIWAGVNSANGKPEWYKVVTDANGKQYKEITSDYSSATYQYTGTSASPKFTGGIMNTFSYKNYSLSVFFNYVYGNQIYNASRVLFDNDGVYANYNAMVPASGWTRWEKPGDIATEPQAVYGGNDNSNATSSRYLENGSYIRLKNITLGYDFPTQFTQTIGMKKLRVFLSGDNLLTFTKYSGTDPEVNLDSDGGYYTPGYSSTNYPTSKKFLIGLTANF